MATRLSASVSFAGLIAQFTHLFPQWPCLSLEIRASFSQLCLLVLFPLPLSLIFYAFPSLLYSITFLSPYFIPQYRAGAECSEYTNMNNKFSSSHPSASI